MNTADTGSPAQGGSLASILAHGLRQSARRLVALLKWALICVMALLIFASIVAFMWNLRAGHDLEVARAAAQARGLPLSMSRICPPGHLEADGQEQANAANYYEAAILVLRMAPPDKPESFTPIISRILVSNNRRHEKTAAAAEEYKRVSDDPRLPLPDYMLADARAHLATRTQVLDLVRQGASVPPAAPAGWLTASVPVATTWYHLDWEDGYDTLLPHLTRIRQITRTLAVSAWVAAEENRPSDAVADVRTALALAKSLNTEPGLISSLVSIACNTIAISQGFAHAAARTDVPPADLELLQRDLETRAREFTMYYAYEGELATACDFLDALADGRKTADEVLSLGGRGMDDSMLPDKYLSAVLKRIPSFYIRGYVKDDEAYMIGYYKYFFDTIANPPAVLPSGGHPMEQELATSGASHVFSRMMLPAISRALLQGELSRLKLRATAAACAAMRYRIDYGAWPETLDALVPEYMGEVPTDTMTGGPLRYVERDGGVVIYSAGENRKDDGGLGPYLGSTEGLESDVDDVGFRVWK